MSAQGTHAVAREAVQAFAFEQAAMWLDWAERCQLAASCVLTLAAVQRAERYGNTERVSHTVPAALRCAVRRVLCADLAAATAVMRTREMWTHLQSVRLLSGTNAADVATQRAWQAARAHRGAVRIVAEPQCAARITRMHSMVALRIPHNASDPFAAEFCAAYRGALLFNIPNAGHMADSAWRCAYVTMCACISAHRGTVAFRFPARQSELYCELTLDLLYAVATPRTVELHGQRVAAIRIQGERFASRAHAIIAAERRGVSMHWVRYIAGGSDLAMCAYNGVGCNLIESQIHDALSGAYRAHRGVPEMRHWRVRVPRKKLPTLNAPVWAHLGELTRLGLDIQLQPY